MHLPLKSSEEYVLWLKCMEDIDFLQKKNIIILVLCFLEPKHSTICYIFYDENGHDSSFGRITAINKSRLLRVLGALVIADSIHIPAYQPTYSYCLARPMSEHLCKQACPSAQQLSGTFIVNCRIHRCCEAAVFCAVYTY